jgi:SAM-dependent methyltransferase
MSNPDPRPCPVCGGLERRLVHTQRFLEGPLGDGYSVVVCTHCGAGFADGIPAQEAMDRYYSEESKYTYGSSGGKESPWDFRRFEATADQVVPHLRSADARILDIGCATGGLLSVIRSRGFQNVAGVDPSPACAEAAARLHGVKVRTAALSHLGDWEERFDLVLMVGALEHIREAGEAVRAASRLLAPGGLLYCAVPDVEGLPGSPGSPFQQFSVEHVNFFSLPSLSRLIGSCGLEPVETARWSVEWRSGVTEAIASGLYRKGKAGEPAFDDRTGPALERYIEISIAGDREIAAVVDSFRASQEPILVWGAGSLARRLLATTSLAEANIVGFIDTNPHLRGAALANRPILAPDQMAGMKERIFICSAAFHGEILEIIREKMGLENPVVSLAGHGERPNTAPGDAAPSP